VGIECILQLVGVVWGDGSDIVGGINRALHQGNIVIVFEHVLVEVALVQSEQVGQNLVTVAALILDVVDGVNALGVGQHGILILCLQQVDGHKGGLPVVGVDHIRTPANLIGGFNHGTGEECKPLAVVIVAVKTASLEIALIVNKVIGHAVLLQLE
jgi:hypothetical protein